MRADGQTTREGALYNQLSGEANGDRRFDPNQPESRRGNTEYIRDRSGREVALRTLQPNGDWSNTRAGLMYFQRARAEVVAQVPVLIRGTRSSGHPYERRDWLPAEDAGVGRIMVDSRLPLRQREIRAKQLVIAQLSNPIMELSGEVFTLDPHGEWFYNDMRTDPWEYGPVVTTQFHTPMGHQLRRAADFIPHADQVLESAYDQSDDRLCVPRQLAELLSEDFHELCADFDDRLENWRPRGITSKELGQWCTDRGLPWTCLADGRVSGETPQEPQVLDDLVRALLHVQKARRICEPEAAAETAWRNCQRRAPGVGVASVGRGGAGRHLLPLGLEVCEAGAARKGHSR